MPLAIDQGVGAVVWSPAGLGPADRQGPARSSRSPTRSRLHTIAAAGPPLEDEYVFKVVDALDAVAQGDRQDRGSDRAELAAWQRPTVSSVIIGARDEAQLRENLGAVGWTLTPEQMKPPGCGLAPSRPPIPTGTRRASPSATRPRCEADPPARTPRAASGGPFADAWPPVPRPTLDDVHLPRGRKRRRRGATSDARIT